MVFSRNMSLSDLVYACTGGRSHHKHQPICQYVIEGQGEIDDQALRNAITKIAVAMPICRVAPHVKWGRKRWIANGPLPSFQTIHRDWDGHNNDVDFLDSPMDLFNDPVIDIIQIVAEKTYIIIRVHHSIMDGVSIRAFILNFFRAMRNETLEVYNSELIEEEIFPLKNHKQYRPAAAKNQPPTRIQDAISPVSTTLSNPQVSKEPSLERAWVRLTIKRNDLLVLPKTLLELSNIARTYAAGNVRFLVPIDLRKLLPNSNLAINLIGVATLDIDENDSIRTLVKKFNAQLNNNIGPEINIRFFATLVRMLPFKLLEKLMRLSVRLQLNKEVSNRSGMVSLLGFPELADCSSSSFTAESIFGIPLSPINSPIFVTICVNEKGSEILLGSLKTRVEIDQLNDLKDKLAYRLAS